MKPNPKMLIPVVLIGGLAVAGYLVDAARSEKHSRISGTFESKPSLLASRSTGRVVKLLADEGDLVSPGQELAILDDPSADATAQAQASNAEAARQRLQETLNGPRVEEIERQRQVVAEAEAEYRRMVNGPLPEEIRASEQQFRAAQAAYQKAVRGARPQEIDAARAQEGQARARLDAAERGPTSQERGQLQAALDSAKATELNARRNYDRYRLLYNEGAVSRQVFENAETTYRTAQAARVSAEQAFNRASLGTPAEELREAREAYRQARANRRLVEAGTRSEDREIARREMLTAQERLNLLRRGTRSEDLAAMRARIGQAKAVLEELVNGSRVEQKAQARSAAEAAEAQARGAKSVAQDRIVRAVTGGQVERLLVAVGDLLQPGSPVVQMADPSDVWLRVYVPEAALASVKVGDAATLRVDGIKDTITAKVESIAAKGEFTPANLQSPEERGKQVFAVRLRLATPDARIKAGMYATATQIGSWR